MRVEGWKKRAKRLGVITITSGLFTGYFPFASGTAGSALAVALVWGIRDVPFITYLILTLFLSALGIWASEKATEIYGQADSGRIVIDEIVGYMITMLAIPVTGYWLAIGFVLFRILDVVKIPPCRYFDERVHNGMGVMMDDIIAGVYGNIILQLMVRANL